jgi:uncharacterized protein with FMN-binding domain
MSKRLKGWKTSVLLLAITFSNLSAQLSAVPVDPSSTMKESAQQIQQGTGNLAASDALANARQGMAASTLALQKAIQNSKINAFLAFFNNPLTGTQFEQFLNAPAATSEAAELYRQRIEKIMDLLAPPASKANQDAAFALLTKASEFESDANICTTIHDAVYAAANSRVEIQRLTETNEVLEKQRKIAEFNNLQASRDRPLDSGPVDKNNVTNNNANQQLERQARMDPTKRELASVGQTIERNKAHIATAEVQAKFQFQALILQLFVQRRYQHVIIANRFYRALFDDGEQSLQNFQQMADKLGYNKDAGQAKLVAQGNPNVAGAVGGGGAPGGGTGASTGTNGSGASVGNNTGGSSEGSALSMSGLQFGVENVSVESLMNAVSSGIKTASRTFKSLSQLDGIANEVIRDVNEGVKSYKFLLSKNEVEGATAQLVAVWMKGQYLPSVQLLSQDEKRRSLKFAQLVNKMISSGQSGNMDALTEAVVEIKKEDPGFDDTEISANIRATKLASSMHVAQARIAASKGDLLTVQAEITRAAGIWPNNPELQNFSTDMGKLSEQADPRVKALGEFDQLYDQKSYRQIFEGIDKYAVAIATDTSVRVSDRREKLEKLKTRMQEIETSIMRSQEIAKREDYAGAWEGLEITFQKYPDDIKLSQMRADLTTQAPNFVHDIREARSYEEKKEYGSALAWYLRSQSRYPLSDLSKQGIQRVVRLILPDSN